jgi:methyl-accepting chemotaxis protein
LHLTLKTKLAAGFGALVGMIVFTGGVGYRSTSRLIGASADVTSSLKQKAAATSLEIAVQKQIRDGVDYVFNASPASLRQYEESKREVSRRLEELSAILNRQEDAPLLSKMRQSTNGISVLTDRLISLRRQSRAYEANDMAFGPVMREAIKRVADDCNELQARQDKIVAGQINVEYGTQALANRITLLVITAGVLLGALMSGLIIRSISRSVSGMLRMIQEISARNLAVEDLQDLSGDEIGEAGTGLNEMRRSLRDMVRSIAATAEQLAASIEEISSAAGQAAETARVQADQTRQVATAMTEMSSTVQQVSENSRTASDSSHRAAEFARQGGQVVTEALDSMRRIAESSGKVATRIAKLGLSSEKIGEIVAVIDEIADQTNLLALNAAIEAARAGEQGRGFAVVADEVRKLAERTTRATKEIATMVESIQVEAKSAVDAIESGSNDVGAGVEKTTASGAALQEIIRMSEQVGDMILQIATAATEQSRATAQVNTSVTQISNLTDESSASAEQTAEACANLSKTALDLQKLVSLFQLDTGRDGADGPHSSLAMVERPPAQSRGQAAGR